MLQFFTDSILRAPTLGSMLMCFASGLIGCLVFLQKRTLVGEALSHAVYPGIVLAIVIVASFFPFSEKGASFAILVGAFVFGLLGIVTINALEKRWKISSDAALCLVLSLFFGFGVLISSSLQISHALWFRQIQVFLFGQAATMVDAHIALYGALALAVLLMMSFLYRYLEILNFDPDYARSLGMPTKWINAVVYFLLVFAIIVGMRSVGIVLMSAMLIAPAAAARQWTQDLKTFFALSSVFGMVSGFFGNAFSVWIPDWIGQSQLSLPTGPMIVLCATFLCLISLLFAPKRGYITRIVRAQCFHFRSAQENVLKALLEKTPYKASRLLLWRMRRKGWIDGTTLTEKGKAKAKHLLRLHELWEVYLIHMGQGQEKVHQSAEEMEHILTPEIEQELLYLLEDTKMKAER